MIEYSVEKLADCLEEIAPLLSDHYEEVAMYQDKVALEPDYDRYLTLADQDILHVVTARDGGDLIGYFISFLMPHIHYSSHTYAVNDILFLDKRYRNASAGKGMFEFAETALKELGVSVMTIHMKTAIPFDSLCESLGYDYAERNYTKYIGE